MTLIKRLQKILALADSPNVNEAAVATAKAAEFMAAYNIKLADVRGSEHCGSDVTAFFLDEEPPADWRSALAKKVAQYCFCEHMLWSKSLTAQHIFVGERHNIAGAVIMYEYLRDTCLKSYEKASKSERMRFASVSFGSGFTSAVLIRIDERIFEEMQATGKALGATPNALVVCGSLRRIRGEQNAAFIEANFGGGEKLPVKGIKDDLDAFHAGVKAGNKVGLDKQVKKEKVKVLK